MWFSKGQEFTMYMSISALRQQLKIVNQVIATGIPVEIMLNGFIVKILLADKKSTMGNLERHDCIVGDSNKLNRDTTNSKADGE